MEKNNIYTELTSINMRIEKLINAIHFVKWMRQTIQPELLAKQQFGIYGIMEMRKYNNKPLDVIHPFHCPKYPIQFTLPHQVLSFFSRLILLYRLVVLTLQIHPNLSELCEATHVGFGLHLSSVSITKSINCIPFCGWLILQQQIQSTDDTFRCYSHFAITNKILGSDAVIECNQQMLDKSSRWIYTPQVGHPDADEGRLIPAQKVMLQ